MLNQQISHPAKRLEGVSAWLCRLTCIEKGQASLAIFFSACEKLSNDLGWYFFRGALFSSKD